MIGGRGGEGLCKIEKQKIVYSIVLQQLLLIIIIKFSSCKADQQSNSKQSTKELLSSSSNHPNTYIFQVSLQNTPLQEPQSFHTISCCDTQSKEAFREILSKRGSSFIQPFFSPYYKHINKYNLPYTARNSSNMQGYHTHHSHHKSKNPSHSSDHLKSSLRLKPKTPLEKQQIIKVNTILAHLINHSDSIDFREPVDYKALQLVDYPLIVQYPMDLGTVNTKLKDRKYKTVEQVLNQIQLIWDNCKLYNPNSSPIYTLADKLQSTFRRMIRNYLPQLKVSSITSAPQRPLLQKPFTIIFQPNRDGQDNREFENIDGDKQKKIEQKGSEKKFSQCENSLEKISNRNVVSAEKQFTPPNQNMEEAESPPEAEVRAISKPKPLNIYEEKKNFVSKLNSLSILDLQQIITVIQEECPNAFSQLDENYAQINVDGMNQESFMKANEALQEIMEKNVNGD